MLIIVCGWGCAGSARATVVVTGTVIQTASGFPNTYTLTLTNNSTAGETVSTFWFAWLPGKDLMAASPNNVGSPTGWTSTITHGGAGDGYGIKYVASTSALAAGNTLTAFTFQSSSSLADLQGNSVFYSAIPVTTSAPNAAGTSTFVAAVEGTDVQSYFVTKLADYDQTDAGTPVVDAEQPYNLFVNVNPGSTGSVLTSSVVAPPAGSTGSSSFQSGSNGIQFMEAFTAKAALDASFTNGTYNLTVRTSTPNTYHTQVILPADSYPAIPKITVSGANGAWTGGNVLIDPTQDFSFTWASFVDVPKGNIYFQINNVTLPGSTSFVADGSTTGYTVPAGILQPNTTYTAQIIFSHIDTTASGNPNPIPGASGGAGFQSEVRFTIQTGSISSSSPTVNIIQKKNVLTQTSTSAPANVFGSPGDDPAPYSLSFDAGVAGSVTGPGAGSPYALGVHVGDSGAEFRYLSGSFLARTGAGNLDATYPDGTYAFKNTSGTTLATVALTGSVYPSIPKVTLVNGTTPVWTPLGQLVLDPTIQNVLTWTAFSGGNFSNAHESAEIYSNSGDGLDVDDESGLVDGGNAFTTLTIPANAMTPGHTYLGSISYLLASSFTNPTPTVYNGAGYTSENTFTVLAGTLGTSVPQTIDFPMIGSQSTGVAPITLLASTSSGLPVTYTVASGPATVSGNVLTVTGAGSITVTVNAAGNANYVAANPVSQTFTVNGQSQTITFPTIGSQTDGVPLTLSASASSGLTVTFSVVSGAATLSGNTLSFSGPGTVTVAANQAGNSTYGAATTVQRTFTVQASDGFILAKVRDYTQTSASGAVANASQGFQFFSNLYNGATDTVLTTSTLTPPAGATGTVAYAASTSASVNGLSFNQAFDTQGALDAAFPDGAAGATGSAAYNLSIKTNAPATYAHQLTFGPDDYPAVTPQITSVTNATWSGGRLVVADPSQAVTITWAAFTANGGVPGAIGFLLSNNSGYNSFQSLPGDGAHNSYTIPANSLPNNSLCQGLLTFGNINATATATFQSQLAFSIQVGVLADVGGYNLTKTVNYNQTGVGTLALSAQDTYQFLFNANPGSAGSLLTSSVLTPPVGAIESVPMQSGSSGLQVNENFNSKAALDAAFPDGSYDLTLRTSTPNTYDTQLNLGTSENYPIVPQVTISGGNGTWTGGVLVVDPTQSVTINWPAFSPVNGGGIYFNVNNTNNLFQNFAADGTHTSYTIPANALSAHQAYHVQISFEAGSANSNPNPILNSGGAAGFQTQVNFTIETGTVAAPSMTLNFVQKTNVLTQTSAGAPANIFGNLVDPAPYNFSIDGSTAGPVTGPGGSYVLNFDDQSTNNPYRYSSAPVASLASLNSLYPDGTYTLADNRTVSLTGDAYPNVPQVTAVNGGAPVWNPLGQLMLDPSVQNVITWAAFSGGTFSTNGHESVELYSNSGDNLDLQTQTGITSGGTAFTTLTIPAGAMTAGHSYLSDIEYTLASAFTNPATNVYDGALYSTENTFTVVATPPLTGSSNAQAIDFPAPSNQAYSSTPIGLIASTSSGLPVTFTVVSGPATVSGHLLTLTGAGTVQIRADSAASGFYLAASSVTQTFQVSSAAQTITFPVIAMHAYPGYPFTITASATSGLPVTFAVQSGPASLSGHTVTLTGTGTVTIIASQAGNSNYLAATNVMRSFSVTAGTSQSFSQWETAYGVSSGPAAVPFKDAVPNLLKYLYNIDPTRTMTAAARAGLPMLGIDSTANPGTRYVTLTYRQYAAQTGITINLQTSADLLTWTTVTPDLAVETGTDPNTGDPVIELGVLPSGSRQFLRLDVSLP